MTASGAMALTGVVFVAAAVVLSFAANNFAIGQSRTRYARLGWAAFSAAAACMVAAAWIEALR